MTTQAINRICHSMMKTGVFHDERQALSILRASVKALRDRLPNDEAYQLGCELPPGLNTWFFEDWDKGIRRGHSVNKAEFLEEVEFHLKDIEEHSLSESVPIAMKEILNAISEDEAKHVRHILPRSLNDIFDDRMAM